LIFAGHDGFADLALVARRRRRAFDAVERLGEDACGAGLTDAACAGEKICVGDAAALQGVDKGLRDGFLADEIAELLRALAARQDRVFGALLLRPRFSYARVRILVPTLQRGNGGFPRPSVGTR
jgi:hypothetical protein